MWAAYAIMESIPEDLINPEQDEKSCSTIYLEGTHCYEKDFINEGLFHCWATMYEEFASGPGNYTVALVENLDGTMTTVDPSNLKFEINENIK